MSSTRTKFPVRIGAAMAAVAAVSITALWMAAGIHPGAAAEVSSARLASARPQQLSPSVCELKDATRLRSARFAP
jgi:hypothetical protein